MARRRYQQPKIEMRTNGSYFIRPYVDIIRPDGTSGREKRVIDLEGCKTKREAQKMAADKMAMVNQPDIVVLAQLKFGQLLDIYVEKHINGSGEIGYTAQKKYLSLIGNHIRPFFGDTILCDMTPMMIQDWLNSKREKYSWATRNDLRNLMSGIFERAKFWKLWRAENPMRGQKIGSKESKYKREEWSIEDTRSLLNALPDDVKLICVTGLLTGLRISELMGLRERSLDHTRRSLNITERYYRGNVAKTKTENSDRRIPLDNWLYDQLAGLCEGDPERYLFHVETRPDWGTKVSTTRDDRSIRANFLRPAAKKLGLYRPGFGFHDLRREAATEYCEAIGEAQASKVMGHGSTLMTRKYNKQRAEVFREAMGDYVGKLNVGEPLAALVQ